MQKKQNKAFTLLEMIIVIIIIGILMAVVWLKVKGFIDSAKLTSATASADSISKSVNQFNTTELWLKSGIKFNNKVIQKYSGQLALRSSDNIIIKGDYIKDWKSDFVNTLKTTYWLNPSMFDVIDSAPSSLSLANKKSYLFVETDKQGNVIKWQLLLYCLKTKVFEGNMNYEGMWSAEASKTDDSTWVENVKKATETDGYNCAVKAIPFTN